MHTPLAMPARTENGPAAAAAAAAAATTLALPACGGPALTHGAVLQCLPACVLTLWRRSINKGESFTVPGRNVTLNSSPGAGAKHAAQSQAGKGKAKAAHTTKGKATPAHVEPAGKGKAPPAHAEPAAKGKAPSAPAGPAGKGAGKGAGKQGSVVDYSRFEKIAAGVSSDEQSDEGDDEWYDEHGGGPDGGGPADQPGAAQAQAVQAAQAPKAAAGGAKALVAPGAPDAERLTLNGGAAASYLWSQTKNSVTISVFVPAGTRAKGTEVAVAASRLKITTPALGALGFDAELWTDIELPEDDDDVDWEIVDVKDDPEARRVISVTLRKTAKFGSAIVMWWKAAVKGGPEIDVSTIKDRKQQAKKGGKTFSQVFAEAEAAFKAKVKAKGDTRVPVDIGSSSGSDAD